MTSQPTHHDRSIDYIEFKVADMARSKAFYERAFGWAFTDYGPADEIAAEIRGPGGPLVVLYGADLTEIMERVEAAGGRIVKPLFDFPGGRRFHFADPDGYELAVWTEAENGS